MNNKKRIVFGFVAINAVGLIAAQNVMAEETMTKNNYTEIKLGIFQPTDSMHDADYDTGGAVSAAYGRYLNKFLVAEVGVDVLGSDATYYGNNFQAGHYKQENSLAGVGLLLTLKGEYSLGPVNLYAGAGGGFYAVSLSSSIKSSDLGDFDKTDSDSVLGGHIVAGATYDINESFYLGVEGKYRWTGDVDIHEQVAAIPVDYKGDLNGYSVTFNAGFRF